MAVMPKVEVKLSPEDIRRMTEFVYKPGEGGIIKAVPTFAEGGVLPNYEWEPRPVYAWPTPERPEYTVFMTKTDADGNRQTVEVPVDKDGTVHVEAAAFIALMEELGFR